jgi:hypothetical protein
MCHLASSTPLHAFCYCRTVAQGGWCERRQLVGPVVHRARLGRLPTLSRQVLRRQEESQHSCSPARSMVWPTSPGAMACSRRVSCSLDAPAGPEASSISSCQLDRDDCRANERRPYCGRHAAQAILDYAQQRRSNSALRTRTYHHAPALLLWCCGLLREVSGWVLWRGSLDGMQGVRGSNPLSSTRHNASAALPLRAVCQQIVSRSLHVTPIAL